MFLMVCCLALLCVCCGSASQASADTAEIIQTALSKCDDQTGQDVLKKKVVERFLTYVSFDTHSDPDAKAFPTSEKEWELGRYLAAELDSIGLQNVECDEFCYPCVT